MKREKMLLVALLVGVVFLFTACATHVYTPSAKSQIANRHIYQEHVPGGKFIPDGETNDYGDHIVTAVGVGVPPDGVSAESPQGEVLAIRAAEVDAKRKLVEQIFGLSMFGKYRTSGNALERDRITSFLRAYIEGASVGHSEMGDEESVLRNCYKDGVAMLPMNINVSHRWLIHMSEVPLPYHPTH